MASNDITRPTTAALRRLAQIALLLGLAGCGAAKPMDFPIPASELDHRPGLLTGDDGEWTVYRK